MIIPNTSVAKHLAGPFLCWAESQGLTPSQAVRHLITDKLASLGVDTEPPKKERPVGSGRKKTGRRYLVRLELVKGVTEDHLRRLLAEAREAGLKPLLPAAPALFGRKDYGSTSIEVRLTEEDIGTLRAITRGQGLRFAAASLSRFDSFSAYLEFIASADERAKGL